MQKAPSALKRKAGPLPVWAWGALALLAAWFFLFRGKGSAGGGTQLPYTPPAPNPVARSGQGTAADNGGSDLASALDSQSAASDALLSALQTWGSGGGYGTASGGTGAAAGTSTAAATAPTVVDSSTPVDTGATALPIVETDSGLSYLHATLGQPAPSPTILDAYLAQPAAAPAPTGSLLNAYVASQSATGPTPTLVQPAPVDTTGVLTQERPLRGVVQAV